ncbi:MAG: histidine kinase [Chitinophagaceae bacterium]
MTRSEKIIRRVADSFVLRNLLLFLIMLSFNTGVPLALGELTWRMLGIEAILMSNSFAAFFIHNLILYRYLLQRRRYLLYILSVITLLFLSSQLYALMKLYFLNEPSHYPVRKWIALFWAEFIYYWAALCVYLAYNYYRDRERLFHIEQEKKELELKQLNEQLNPHFLFNALNNIYSNLLSQPDSGKELILKLSELMRYVLDSSKKPEVTLEEEITFIEHYISFEQERLGERCRVNYTRETHSGDATIIPLLLFTFIENAFKHGTTGIRSTAIDIAIKETAGELFMSVSNEIGPAAKTSTRTGLENTRKRLQLLYPAKHKLDIQEIPEKYIVHLNLTLS